MRKRKEIKKRGKEKERKEKNWGPKMDVTHDRKNCIIKNYIILYTLLNILRVIKSKGMIRICNI
jgi:hypothetical protein